MTTVGTASRNNSPSWWTISIVKKVLRRAPDCSRCFRRAVCPAADCQTNSRARDYGIGPTMRQLFWRTQIGLLSWRCAPGAGANFNEKRGQLVAIRGGREARRLNADESLRHRRVQMGQRFAEGGGE